MNPNTVHFVGSIPLSSSIQVFERLITSLPGVLRRIPDGETGERSNFIGWQRAIFEPSPFLYRPNFRVGQHLSGSNGLIKLNPTGYDVAALASYEDFCSLRQKGTIPPGVRFQVSLPTPINVVGVFIDPNHKIDAEMAYENLLLSALRRIQDSIPKHDLSIQWDAALEFGMLEGIAPAYQKLAEKRQLTMSEWPGFCCEPWFSPVQEGIVERLIRLSSAVDEGVELGFHLCYGDSGHKHFVEPKDSRHLVEMSNLILGAVKREVNWIHMPVPKERTDEEYYAPMRALNLGNETELYLGLAHAGDLQGTKQRVEAAGKVVKSFGIATECGMGRMDKEEVDAVFAVLAAMTTPAEA